MSPPLIVLLCAALAAGAAFIASAWRGVAADPVDPQSEERALVRAISRRPRLARFLRQRVDRRSAGGFLVTISFVVVVAVALVLGLLLDMVDERRGLAQLDESVAEWGSEHATSESIDVIEAITELGSTTTVIIALAITATYDYARRRNVEVIIFLATIGGGQLLINNALKLRVDRERPDVMQLVETSGASFPSGHSAAAAATWSAVALILSRDRSRPVRAVLAAAAAMIAVSVAASRALLGVHWLTDVVGGLAVGWGWFLLVAIFFGGRAQRLGDPVSAEPQGTRSEPAAESRAG